jgi:hypothetical protein
MLGDTCSLRRRLSTLVLNGPVWADVRPVSLAEGRR